MAKRKTPKAEKVIDLTPKPEKITDSQLKTVQTTVKTMEHLTTELGRLGIQKYGLLKGIENIQTELDLLRQELINNINRHHLQVGQVESQKHSILHGLAGLNDELVLMRDKFKTTYNTDDINIADGSINYNETN